MKKIIILAILIIAFCVSPLSALDPCHCDDCVGYDGPGGPCYDGPGGAAYSGPGGTGEDCPDICIECK